MNLNLFFKRTSVNHALPFAVVALAAGLRIWPLHSLGSGLAWLTFYPAVMVVAIYGGLFSGFLAALLSCLVITFGWSMLADQPFISHPSDWLGMSVFVLTSIMISGVAEAMRRAETNALKSQKQAEEANLAKSRFLSTMSHELRTPLNAILGFSGLMRNDLNLNDEQRQNLDIINRSGEHLLSLINDVLDMSKIEAGRVVLEIAPFDFGVLVRDIMDMLSKRAEIKGLQLLLDQSLEFPRYIKSDQEKLRQVIVNLVGNAIKFTHRGSVTLRVGVKSGDALIIEVEDSGVGISEADQQRVFEPFVQLGQQSQKGTGLGLAIVREYIRLMGGQIEIQSTAGIGSLFRVILPLQRATGAEIISPGVEEGAVIGLKSGQPDYRILIVEDQYENELLLQRLLVNAGFDVKVAKSGAEGIALFQSYHPHFIWMDKRMPVMDGIETTRRIRALPGGLDVKISAVTASAFANQRDELLAAGMNDFVCKPYRPAEIFDCMVRQLGVQFVHAKARQTEPESSISPVSLSDFPEALRLEFSESLVLGNTELLEKLLIRITRHNPELGKVLEQHVSAFNYLPVLNALDAVATHKEIKL
jgi:signal transduction histidine kinase/DNA-binding response OmpR family regulator